jgi:hypothetical protein
MSYPARVSKPLNYPLLSTQHREHELNQEEIGKETH